MSDTAVNALEFLVQLAAGALSFWYAFYKMPVLANGFYIKFSFKT